MVWPLDDRCHSLRGDRWLRPLPRRVARWHQACNRYACPQPHRLRSLPKRVYMLVVVAKCGLAAALTSSGWRSLTWSMVAHFCEAS